MEWTEEQLKSLINEYKSRPVLWDPSHVMYRVQTAKYEAWCELAEIFECEIADLRKKFNSVFASHRREKSKVRQGSRSTWFLYETLSFLPNHLDWDDSVEHVNVVHRSTDEMEWSEEQIKSVINEYKNRPVLWDPSHVMYRVHTAKYEAWCELAEIFKCEMPDLRKKFHSIFSSHRREKAKVRQGTRSTWFLYETLSFLPNHLDCDDSTENVNTVHRSMNEIQWTDNQIKTLINEYKNRPVLWDPNHTKYRIPSAKNEAWDELAKIFKCEIIDLRKKFHSIFSSHRREKSKVRQGSPSTWFLYEILSFLPNHLDWDDSADRVNVVKKRKKKEVVEEHEADDTEDEYEEESNRSPVHIIVKEEPEITQPKVNYVCSKPRLTRLLKRRVVKENPIPERGRVIERKIYKRPEIYNNKKKDECDSFGEYIAMSLRKHNERTRSMIKQAINNILFEQEMKKYNNSSGQYVIISNVEENPLISGDECEK